MEKQYEKQRGNNLILFNDKFLPRVFALQNNGVLCYLNSMTQALMSCPSLNYCLLKCKGQSSFTENELAQTYVELFEKHPSPVMNNEDSSSQTDCKFQAIKVDDASKILLLINRARLGKKDNLLVGRQEDIHEGIMLFLDTVQHGTENLFHIRNRCEIWCRSCGTKRPVEHEEPPEIMVDLSEERPYIQDNMVTKEDIEKYISGNAQIPRDYKCDQCGSANTYNKENKTVTPNVIQIYNLTRLSEIIILMFKKFTNKKERYFPPTLEFTSKTGPLHYKVVAQLEHSGSMTGGHYVCKCLRNKPSYMHEMRRQKAYNLIEKNEKILNREDTIEYKRSQAVASIVDLKANLAKDEELCKEKYGVFCLNDSKATFCPEGFVPTNNTYMVFYHLYNPDDENSIDDSVNKLAEIVEKTHIPL
jgi:hypothetical protein